MKDDKKGPTMNFAKYRDALGKKVQPSTYYYSRGIETYKAIQQQSKDDPTVAQCQEWIKDNYTKYREYQAQMAEHDKKLLKFVDDCANKFSDVLNGGEFNEIRKLINSKKLLEKGRLSFHTTYDPKKKHVDQRPGPKIRNAEINELKEKLRPIIADAKAAKEYYNFTKNIDNFTENIDKIKDKSKEILEKMGAPKAVEYLKKQIVQIMK